MAESVKLKRILLSATLNDADIGKLTYPLAGSYKLDGIRCFIHHEFGPVSRTFKPIPNNHIRSVLEEVGLLGLDGEVITLKGDGTPDDFNTIQSKVMSQAGEPSFTFAVFDHVMDPSEPFLNRYDRLVRLFTADGGTLALDEMGPFSLVRQYRLASPVDIANLAMEAAELHYEGIMLRCLEGIWKQGRSTLNQQILLKYKPWADAEGIIVGFEEMLHNNNEQERDLLGYAKRTSHKANMVAGNMLGALILNTEWGELRVGSGFDHALRSEIWMDRDAYFGRKVTFKYQKYGMKDKPRFPIFKGFRPELEDD